MQESMKGVYGMLKMDNKLELYEYWCKNSCYKQQRYITKFIDTGEIKINSNGDKFPVYDKKTEDRYKKTYEDLMKKTLQTYGYTNTRKAMDNYFTQKQSGQFAKNLDLYQFMVAIWQFIEYA